MNGKKLLGAALAVGLGLFVSMHAPDASAQGKAKPKKEAGPDPYPPVTKKPIILSLPSIQWGMPPDKVADVIDKVLDDDYRPLYKEVQPGVRMKALDAQLAEDKSAFRRSRIDFGKLPTGVDASALRGEYTYMNRETMLTLTRKGETIAFFFIQDRLWKMIGEHALVEGSAYGKDFTSAVVKLTGIYGVPGRVLQPDGTHFSVEVDWKDQNNHLRVIQRSDTALAMALEDLVTMQALASLRSNKPADGNAIDPSVAASLRHDDAPAPPPSDKDKKPPKK